LSKTKKSKRGKFSCPVAGNLPSPLRVLLFLHLAIQILLEFSNLFFILLSLLISLFVPLSIPLSFRVFWRAYKRHTGEGHGVGETTKKKQTKRGLKKEETRRRRRHGIGLIFLIGFIAF
jgi:hypothetical protein